MVRGCKTFSTSAPPTTPILETPLKGWQTKPPCEVPELLIKQAWVAPPLRNKGGKPEAACSGRDGASPWVPFQGEASPEVSRVDHASSEL